MTAALWVILLAQEDVLTEGVEVTPSQARRAIRSPRADERCLRIGDAEAFDTFWKELGGKEVRPPVDFAKEMVLVLPLRQKCCSGLHSAGRRITVRETPDAVRFVLGYQDVVSQPPVRPGHVHQDSASIALAVVPRRDKAVEFYLRLETLLRGDEVLKAEPLKLLARVR